jgi:hypothetical protein
MSTVTVTVVSLTLVPRAMVGLDDDAAATGTTDAASKTRTANMLMRAAGI